MGWTDRLGSHRCFVHVGELRRLPDSLIFADQAFHYHKMAIGG
jgi:hypothetical protein